VKVLKQMIHTALRDDSSLRTTLGHAAVPYGIYEAFFPESSDFSSKSYVTWQFLGGAPVDATIQNEPDMRRRIKSVSITGWSADQDTLEDIHRRIRRILVGMQSVTVPSADAEVQGIEHADEGPDLFDDDKKVYFRAETYRIMFREDITS
jgi:hypothetical protein